MLSLARWIFFCMYSSFTHANRHLMILNGTIVDKAPEWNAVIVKHDSVSDTWYPTCSGALFNKGLHMMTAGHCNADLHGKRVLRGKGTVFDTNDYCNIESFITEYNFTQRNKESDFGIVTLTNCSALDITSPPWIPTSMEVAANETLDMFAWGRHTSKHPPNARHR